MSETNAINDWLRANYGHTLDGKPIWRLVWSDEQLEKIKDTFTDYQGPIYLRTVTEVREVPKYPFIKGRWMLEKIQFIDLKAEDSFVIDKKFSYECIFIFQDKFGNILPLNRDVIEIIIYFYLNRIRSTEQDLSEEERKKDEAEKDYFRQKIGENQQIPHLMDLIY